MLNPRWLWLVVALPACSRGGRGDEVVGGVGEGLGPGYYIGDIAIDPNTYHWASPDELLTSAEGAGPRTLYVSVAAAVTPHIAFTGTHSPSHSDLSTALGWDVAASVQLSSETSVLVPVDAYARVDAYTTYQKTTWMMVGVGQVPIGMGATYRPIGVYYSTCGCIGPDPCGVGCVNDFPYGAASGAPAVDGGADGG